LCATRCVISGSTMKYFVRSDEIFRAPHSDVTRAAPWHDYCPPCRKLKVRLLKHQPRAFSFFLG
jgi:hypothetical protein